MTSHSEQATALLGAVEAAVQAARTGELLESALAAMGLTIATLRRVVEADPDLVPEVETMLAGMGEVSAALGRAAEFAQVRQDVAADKLRETWGGDE